MSAKDPRAIAYQETLSSSECELLADTLFEDAVRRRAGSKRDSLIKLANACRELARLKRTLTDRTLVADAPLTWMNPSSTGRRQRTSS